VLLNLLLKITKVTNKKHVVTINNTSRLWQAILCYYVYIPMLLSGKVMDKEVQAQHIYCNYLAEVENFIGRKGIWADIEEDILVLL
jgi:hypothetical protein